MSIARFLSRRNNITVLFAVIVSAATLIVLSDFTKSVYSDEISQSLLPLWLPFNYLIFTAAMLIPVTAIGHFASLASSSQTKWHENNAMVALLRLLTIPAVTANSLLLLLHPLLT